MITEQELIDRVKYCEGSEVRPAYAGVRIERTDAEVMAIALDGHRMAVATVAASDTNARDRHEGYPKWRTGIEHVSGVPTCEMALTVPEMVNHIARAAGPLVASRETELGRYDDVHLTLARNRECALRIGKHEAILNPLYLVDVLWRMLFADPGAVVRYYSPESAIVFACTHGSVTMMHAVMPQRGQYSDSRIGDPAPWDLSR